MNLHALTYYSKYMGRVEVTSFRDLGKLGLTGEKRTERMQEPAKQEQPALKRSSQEKRGERSEQLIEQFSYEQALELAIQEAVAIVAPDDSQEKRTKTIEQLVASGGHERLVDFLEHMYMEMRYAYEDPEIKEEEYEEFVRSMEKMPGYNSKQTIGENFRRWVEILNYKIVVLRALLQSGKKALVDESAYMKPGSDFSKLRQRRRKV